MTRDEVIAMARECGWIIHDELNFADQKAFQNAFLEMLERFRALVEAKPKEAAYKAGWIAAAKWANRTDLTADTDSLAYIAERDAAIRTRGEGTPT